MPDLDSSEALRIRGSRPGSLIFGVSFLIVSLLLLSLLDRETQWIAGSKLLAQPALWPALGLAGMSLFALAHLCSVVRAYRRSTSSSLGDGASEFVLWLKAFEYALWFMVYVWIVPIIGYLPASLIFATALAFRAGYRDKHMLLKAAAMSVAVVVLFKSLLAVKIPGGRLYAHLPDGIRNLMLSYF